MREPAIIVDLDNCFYDSRILDKYAPKNNSTEEWREFQKHFKDIIINWDFVNVVKQVQHSGVNILFVTSREATRDLTILTVKSLIDILQNANFKLFMRKEFDTRPASTIKKEIYIGKIKDKYNVLLCIDDEKSNCEMFASLDLFTYQYDIENVNSIQGLKDKINKHLERFVTVK